MAAQLNQKCTLEILVRFIFLLDEPNIIPLFGLIFILENNLRHRAGSSRLHRPAEQLFYTNE